MSQAARNFYTPEQFQVLRMQALCYLCGFRRGLHRVGDERCPQPLWKPGNGQPQWRETWRFKAAR